MSRYIGWFLTAPLLVLNMALFSGLNWVVSLFMATLVEIYVICGLIGALVSTSYKWGYFTIGAVAWILLFYNFTAVAVPSLGTLNACTVEPKLRSVFLMILGCVGLIYSLYPVAWGLAEGGNVISPTSEGVFYGILDILALPALNSAVLFFSRKLDIDELGLGIPEGTRNSAPAKSAGAA